MSTDAAALVRRAYDAWNLKGLEAFATFLSERVELRDAPQLPDAALWRGRDSVLRRLEDVASAVGGGWVELYELRPLARGILVEMEWKLDDRRRGSSIGTVFHLVEVAEQRISSIRVFLEEREALAEAGGAGDR